MGTLRFVGEEDDLYLVAVEVVGREIKKIITNNTHLLEQLQVFLRKEVNRFDAFALPFVWARYSEGTVEQARGYVQAIVRGMNWSISNESKQKKPQ